MTLDGGGTVDLGQLANASDDEILTYGEILNAPGTSGDGLVNVNNTITGGGLIDLGSFDNQASGVVEASQTGGFLLQIIASTFTNEGTLAAQSGSALDLGQDGDTGSLTNTGPIDLASNGDSGDQRRFHDLRIGRDRFQGRRRRYYQQRGRGGDIHQRQHDQCGLFRPDRRHRHSGGQ